MYIRIFKGYFGRPSRTSDSPFQQTNAGHLNHPISFKMAMAFSKEQREAFSRRGAKALEQLAVSRADRCFWERVNRERRMTSARTARVPSALVQHNRNVDAAVLSAIERPFLGRKLEEARRTQRELLARTRQFCLRLTIFD